MRNNSPGLFAEDSFKITLNLEDNTQLYLTEQSATKVHPMVNTDTAKVNYQWNIGKHAIVEFVPEPLILYSDSALKQTTQVRIHPSASLFWSDVVLPGRLARGESYQFRDYDHCLEVYGEAGELWFRDSMHLTGKENKFAQSSLFASLPVLGNAIALLPQIEVNLLKTTLDSLKLPNTSNLVVATSVLPQDKGVLLRVLGSRTQDIKSYWHSAINTLRKLNQQPPLSHVPK